MVDRFHSAQLKLERAGRFVNDLEAEIRAYWSTSPVSTKATGAVVTVAGGTGVQKVSVKSVQPLPDNIALLVGDAAHNMRSALDHFAWAAVSGPDRQTMFPIWGRESTPIAAEWEREVRRRLRGASPALQAAVLKLQPWPTGHNPQLWHIHELDRIDKHRLLISVAAAKTATVFEIAPAVLNPDSSIQLTTRRLAVAPQQWEPLEAGTVLWDVPEGAKPAPDPLSFEYDLALGEPEDLKGKPAVTQLRILISHAETAIRQLTPAV
jgi:hypothetical protein